tara:strand:- start:344 stop:868 length:525 start_codon:yes stop_codon:yes gene_type:complete
MDECPPPLVVFEIDRSTSDGITRSVGWEATPTRQVHVKYEDNRSSYEHRLWLSGEANLTNWRHESALVRYRHRVRFDPWLLGRPSNTSSVCVDDGVVTGFWEVRLDPRESVTIDVSWSVDLFDRADMNRDGVVDVEDLGIFLTHFGTEQSIADLDESGIVDGYDLGLFFSRWTG